jgi:glucose/arabinose dehydrogenase
MNISRLPILLGVATALLGGCGSNDSGKPPAQRSSPEPGSASQGVRLQSLGRFAEPVLATAAPNRAGIAVVEQRGRVMLLRGSSRRMLVDLRDEVSFGGEQGLLGLAFSSDGSEMYLNYTDREGNTRIVQVPMPARDSGPVRSAARTLLMVEQPYSNHNGGMLALGPDGGLYAGMGDGGSAGDPENRSQDPNSLLGKLLRVDTTQGGATVVAQGLRNPWRFSFDVPTNSIWIGDVGQNRVEEVNAVPFDQLRSTNFGWNGWEGRERFAGGISVPVQDVTMPVYTYSHDDGCSVTGGVVYRGQAIPELRGSYLFADYCSSWIRAIPAARPGTRIATRPTEIDAVEGISGFGVDADGEVLVSSLSTNRVYRVVAR